jgi:hypothetical protein
MDFHISDASPNYPWGALTQRCLYTLIKLAENPRAYNACVDNFPQKGYNSVKALLLLELADGKQSGYTKDAAVGRTGKKG